MGKCIYCGEKVGMFKKYHKECEEEFISGKNKIFNMLKYFNLSTDILYLKNSIQKIQSESYINDVTVDNIILTNFDNMMTHFLLDGILTTEQKEIIEHYVKFVDNNIEKINKNLSYNKVAMSQILECVIDGDLPNVTLDIKLPFTIIDIQKEGATAKPQTFIGVDGWFVENLIENLNK